MEKLECTELLDYFEEFYVEYFQVKLKEKNRKLTSSILLSDEFEKDMGFDWADIDAFIYELSKRFMIDISKFHQNLHIEGKSCELILPFTKVFIMFVGLKKWMVFN